MARVLPPLAEERFALMGAAFEVHNVLGGGLAEEIYRQSLERGLGLRNIPYRRKQPLTVNYKGAPLETKYTPDLVVLDRIIVDLKAVVSLCAEHESQLRYYVRITRFPIGYLINTSTPSISSNTSGSPARSTLHD